MKRVLHYVIGSMNQGGLENNLMDLYRNINRDKYQFDFIVHTKDCYYRKEIESLGGRIYYLPFKSKNYKEAINKYKNIILNDQYDVIHFHVSYANVLSEAKIAHSFGKKIILHGHASAGDGFKKLLFNNICKRKLDNISDIKIAVSEQSAKWQFSEKTLKQKEYFIINNSINIEKFKYDSKIRKSQRKTLRCDNSFILGTTGRLVKGKNIQYLIKLTKKMLNNNNDIKLIIVGDGPDKKRLENSCKGIQNNVIFIGETQDVNKYLNAFDVFCFPSLHEGLGLSVIEAQCAGLPCLINESLPSELDVTNLIHRAKLNYNLWESKLIEIYEQKTKRTDMTKVIKRSGFDPKSNAKIIENIYNILMTNCRDYQ